ncbi:MAG: pyrimidine/purine nucleoside phosphorylase [Candidatus Gracilibacteria bacterium]|jgi:uncharacterized protein YaiE (UPF0345 family)
MAEAVGGTAGAADENPTQTPTIEVHEDGLGVKSLGLRTPEGEQREVGVINWGNTVMIDTGGCEESFTIIDGNVEVVIPSSGRGEGTKIYGRGSEIKLPANKKEIMIKPLYSAPVAYMRGRGQGHERRVTIFPGRTPSGEVPVNDYGSNLKSLGYIVGERIDGKYQEVDATVGVLNPGNPFMASTTREEHVTVLSGKLRVTVESGESRVIQTQETIILPANTQNIQLEAMNGHQVAYRCLYIGPRVEDTAGTGDTAVNEPANEGTPEAAAPEAVVAGIAAAAAAIRPEEVARGEAPEEALTA